MYGKNIVCKIIYGTKKTSYYSGENSAFISQSVNVLITVSIKLSALGFDYNILNKNFQHIFIFAVNTKTKIRNRKCLIRVK